MNSVLLSDFCTFVQGGRHKLSGKHFVDRGFPAYGAGGINGYLPNAEFDRSAVVLSSIGARCGKCFLAEGSWSSLANTQVIFPDPQKGDVRFLWYQLNDEMRWPRKGIAQPFIRPSDVKAHRVFLPPLYEQRRIAAVLDKADAMHRKRKRALELLDGLTQSIFSEMFGDPILNTLKWPIKRLADFEVFLTSGSRGWAQYYADAGRAFIRIGNVKGGEVDTADLIYVTPPDNAEARRTLVKQGDLLISITADLGRVAVVPNSLNHCAHINQHLALVRLKKLNPYFAAQYLASAGGQRQFEALNRQGVKAGLNFDNIRSLAIFAPPIERQEAFESAVKHIATHRTNTQRAVEESSRLFASIQYRYFSCQV